MRKRKNTNSVPEIRNQTAYRRFGPPDFVVLLICLAGVLFFLLLFRNDMYRSLTRLNDIPVGTVTWKEKAAQRRFVDRVLWDRLQKHSPVYNGDLIRTAEYSGATVTFSAGEIIDLADNTLVRISRNDAVPRIDLTQGAVSVNTAAGNGAGIILSSGNTNVTITAGAVVNAGAADSNGNLTLLVSEGSATVSGAAGTWEAEAGTAFSLDSEGTAGTEPLAAVSSPRPDARYLNPARGPLAIPFAWNRMNYGENDRTRIEIAADRAFTRPAFDRIIAEDSITVSLESGTWWWKVYPDSASPANAITGKLTIVNAPAPALITPAEAYLYRYRTRQSAVRFQWTETGDAVSYLLEAADNPDFRNPALRTQVQGTSLIYSKLNPGHWYWRVRPVFSGDYEGNTAAAMVSYFDIEQADVLTAPVLSLPLNGGRVNTIAGAQDIYFSWKFEEEADTYTIQISPNRDLSNPVISETVFDNFYAYRPSKAVLEPGQYYWTVYQTDLEGNNSPIAAAYGFSSVQNEETQRTIFPPDNYTIAENLLSETRFTWKSPLPNKMRFQVSASQDFSSPVINEPATGDSIAGKRLPLGTWYWRIVAAGDDGALIPGQRFQSAAKQLSVVSAFPQPVIESPLPGSRLFIRENNRLEFRWRAVSGAGSYLFRLYRGTGPAGNANQPLFETTVSREMIPAMDWSRYGNGDYFWTVQAMAEENRLQSRRTGLTANASFTVQNLRPISLDYPPQNTVIKGLTAANLPTMVRWSTAETVGTSRFILSRNANPLRGTPVMTINNPGREIRLNRLEPGTYYWTVQGENRDGFDISPAAPGTFRVLPVAAPPVAAPPLAAPPPVPAPPVSAPPPAAAPSVAAPPVAAPPPAAPPVTLLPAAGQLRPENNYVIGPAQLRSSREISFTWNSVGGANAYIFSLFPDNGEPADRKEIIRTEPLRQPSYTIKDLSVLDVGNFIWQVEAVQVGNDGSVIRHGTIVQNRFTIDIPLPNDPKRHNSGTLYGL
ncbi:hypothetical protein AGMMS49546_00200 [Spirochaetia bacterium]|nr:hypothetical protein AGMMS49546_00200 [Spirochaetia bacterium]